MTAAVYEQETIQGRDDDVALNSGTFNGGGGENGNWSQDADTNFRLRVLVIETAGGAQQNQTFTLFFNHEGAGYVEMTTSTLLRPAATTQYANADTTTQVLGTGTYISADSEGGVDDAEDSGKFDYAANNEGEVEFCLTIDGPSVSNDDEILVQVYETDGTALTLYTVTPTITVTGIVGPTDPLHLQTLINQAVNRSHTY